MRQPFTIARLLAFGLLLLPVNWQLSGHRAAEPAGGTGGARLSGPALSPPEGRLEDLSIAFFVPRGHSASPEDFLERFGKRLGLGADDEMVEYDRGASLVTGRGFVRFRQHYRGVPLSGAGYTLTLEDERVLRGSGVIVSGLSAVVEPGISAEEALRLARKAVSRRLGKRFDGLAWDDADQVRLLLVSRADRRDPGSYQLVYSGRIRPADTGISYLVHIDALTGALRRLQAEVREAWDVTSVTGMSKYEGMVGPFTAQKEIAGARFRLRSLRVVTFSLAGAPPSDWDGIATKLNTAVDIESGTDVFDQPGHENGVSVHWATLEALGMFENAFGASFPDMAGPGQPLITNYVDVPFTDYFAANAYWLNSHLFGRASCDVVALDVVGHEMGHFFIHQVFPQFTGDDCVGECGSLLESFSDILGQLLEIRVKGSTDWISGSQITCPDFLAEGKVRNLADPLQGPVTQPDVYGVPPHWKDPFPATELNDWGHMHHNTGIQNKWFYLLAMGEENGINSTGTSYDVTGVGTETAAKVLLRTMEELQDGSEYAQARDISTLAAAEICGVYSQERVSVHEAWRAVGLYQAPFDWEPFTEPAEAATGVHPWPATLFFEIPSLLPEDSWRIEVSENQDFSGPLQSVTTDVTGQLGVVQVGMAEFSLEPDRQYFWRVRPASTPAGLACWRPVRSFRTAKMTVDPISPILQASRGEPYHPWELEFSWSSHPQASSYSIEVAKTLNFEGTLIQQARPTGTKVVLDVLVDRLHHWRVRPNYTDADGNEIAGTWTEASFLTSMPAVQTTAPGFGEDVYPWPVNFEWKPVKGAGNFIFQIKLARAGWGDPYGEERSFPFPASQTSHELNLRGDDYSISFHWRVRVIGPKIESLGLAEEGLPAERYFKVDGTLTIPEPLTLGPNLCVPLNQQLDLKWKTVLQASSYEISVFEGLCPENALCQQGERLHTDSVLAQPSSTQWYSYRPKPMAHNDAIGLIWTVRSFGPGGVPGMASSAGKPVILAQPTRPEPVAPPDMTEFELDDPVTLSWQSGMAHWGGFVLNVYKGSNSDCQGPPQKSFVRMGVSSGVTSTTLTNLQFDSGSHNHSWKVRPFIVGLNHDSQYYDPCQKPQWSDCNRFVVTDQIPDLAKPTGLLENGVGNQGFMAVFWEKAPGVESYLIKVRSGSQNGPVFDTSLWNVNVLAAHKAEWDQLLLDIFGMPSDPSIWIAKIDGVPPGVYWWEVKACRENGTDCGPPSDPSKWTEHPF